MDILEALKTRKSIRDFKPEPVSKAVIKEILELAGRAPSAENSQPWEFAVIGGEVLEQIRQANVERLRAGIAPNPEYEAVKWPRDSIFRRRQVEIAKQLFGLLEIPREDKAKRARWMERGFSYFNAPVAIIILMEQWLPQSRPLLDIGAAMQNICLAALNYGLGTCIANQGVMYPDVLRKFAKIPRSRRIVTSIAMGYPNWDFAANAVASDREPIENITSWCGI